MKQGDFYGFFKAHYSALLHLPPLRFHCVGGCRDRIQDSCDLGIDIGVGNVSVRLGKGI
jgi:hypothetical protein